jgi:hypothetical protein
MIRVLGAAGAGKEWHHIVGQTPANVTRFGAEAVHNVGNVVAVDRGIHLKITGFYNSIQPFSGGVRVREWLANQPFEQQAQFGRDILTRFGVGQ